MVPSPRRSISLPDRTASPSTSSTRRARRTKCRGGSSTSLIASVASGTGRVYAEGETATFTGKTVAIRSGNGAVTNITYNGVYQGTMGSQGQVAEKVYRAQ